jgi:hypothetical protein
VQDEMMPLARCERFRAVCEEALGDARERAHLRVRQLAAFHRRQDPRQRRQRMRDANVLARGAEVDAALPVQPARAGLRGRVRPAFAPIEQQREQPMVGSVQGRRAP